MLPPETLRHSQRQLLEFWFNNIEAQSLQPTINRVKAIDLLSLARFTCQEICFVAIGCADWQDWGDKSENLWHVGKIGPGNKRARRFSEEVGQFQQSLNSLGISSEINFALSNVEIIDPIARMLDSALENHEQAEANIAISQQNFELLLGNAGAKIHPFNHWQIWQEHGRSTAATYLDFMADLFKFDLTVTAPAMVKPDQLGPIWLDCQSNNFNEVTNLFKSMAGQTCLPVLNPFKNAGNWHARPEPKNIFPNVFDLMQSFGFKPALNKVEWESKALKIPDDIILAALKSLADIDCNISDWPQRKLAVSWLSQIVFI